MIFGLAFTKLVFLFCFFEWMNAKRVDLISRLRLVQQVIVYFDTSGKNRKKTKKLLTDIVVDGCPANNSLVFKEDIKVPAVPPTDSHSSKILQISYEIKVVPVVDILSIDEFNGNCHF